MFSMGMWEEKDSSDTRLLFDPRIPDRLTIAGRSCACTDQIYREHVVPRVLIANEIQEMFANGCADEEVALYIREHVKIVEITKEVGGPPGPEVELFDLKTKMPEGWAGRAGGDIYARLAAAGGSEWDPPGPRAT